MRHNIPKPIISPNFTIDDIHKIRELNYECQKDMTPEERAEDTAKNCEEALKRRGKADTVKRLKK
jgi:hypothetical protein